MNPDVPRSDCRCCEGTSPRTPRSVANRQGRGALSYRVGTRADFLASMKARLGDADFLTPGISGPHALDGLATRDSSDPAIALLDAWAVVADVLTFYQERIANEGFLRTATESRSIAELGKLVGYAPRPGVASSVHLAYSLEIGQRATVTKGNRAQTVPDPGQLPQAFETSSDLAARDEWNALKPLLTRPQAILPGENKPGRQELRLKNPSRTIYLKGVSANLKSNDPLLLIFDGAPEEVWRVKEARADAQVNLTSVVADPWEYVAPKESGLVVEPPAPELLKESLENYKAHRHDGPFSGFHRRQADLGALMAEVLKAVESTQETDAEILLKALLAEDDAVDDLRASLAALRSTGTATRTKSEVEEEIKAFDVATIRLPFGKDNKNEQRRELYFAAANFADRRIDELRRRLTIAHADATPEAKRDRLAGHLEEASVELSEILRPELRLSRLQGRIRKLALALNGVHDDLAEGAITADDAIGKSLEAVKDCQDDDPIHARIDKVELKLDDLLKKLPPNPSDADVAEFREKLRQKVAEWTNAAGSGIEVGDDLNRPLPALLLALAEALDAPLVAVQARGGPPAPGTPNLVAVTADGRATSARLSVGRVIDIGGALGELIGVAVQSLGADTEGTEVGKRIKFYLELAAENMRAYGAFPEGFRSLEPEVLASLAEALPPGPEADLGLATRLRRATLTLAVSSLLSSLGQEAGVFEGGRFRLIRPTYEALVSGLEKVVAAWPLDFAQARAIQQAVSAADLPASADEGSPRDRAPVLGLLRRGLDPLTAYLERLLTTRTLERPNAAGSPGPGRAVRKSFSDQSDATTRLLSALDPRLEGRLYPALANASVGRTSPLRRVEVLRATALPFGATAPLQVIETKSVTKTDTTTTTTTAQEWKLAGKDFSITLPIQTDFRKAVVTLTAPTTSSAPTVGPRDKDKLLIEGVTASREQDDDLPRTAIIIRFAIEGDEVSLVVDRPQDDASLTVQAGGKGRPQPFAKVGDTFTFEFDQGKIVSTRLDAPPRFEFRVHFNAHTTVAKRDVLALDATYDRIVPGSYIVVDRTADEESETTTLASRVSRVETLARTDFNATAKVTQLTLEKPWLEDHDRLLSSLRRTSILCQSEPLDLAEEPYDADVSGDRIQLDRVYDGLEAGRLLIVEGERTDLPGTRGVVNSELVVLSGSEQGTDTAGTPEAAPGREQGRPHTTIFLDRPLTYSYRRDSVTIYGNVVKATHGETRREVLGSGDASGALQRFELKQGPLTYLPATTAGGADDTLEVRVDGVLWHQAERFTSLRPGERKYVLSRDDSGRVAVQFGDGLRGARLPRGSENVRAVYRTGLGRSGNSRAKQISQLATRPLGVKEVVNPMPATGGADRETIEQARANVPVGITSLDRLVSVRDYEDFARGFAGIAKASAVRDDAGAATGVFLTVAGADDMTLDPEGDLLRALAESLRLRADPALAVPRIAPRRLMLLFLSARVEIDPDHLWDDVAARVRERLLRDLGFDRRGLAQPLPRSIVLAHIQAVRGVVSVVIDAFGAIAGPEDGRPPGPTEVASQVADAVKGSARECVDARPSSWSDEARRMRPAELLYLSPKVPETLALAEIER